VNSVVSQTEQVPVHTVDVIAGTLGYWLQACVKAKVKKEMVSKAWDLKTAYKQLPLSDSAFELDSYIAVFCPRSKKPQVYKQRVLPFGSKASVTGFIRCAYGLWKIGCVLLALIWSCYFDDFLASSWEDASKHLDMIVTMFFRLFGWNVSLDKQLGFDSMCNVLGVTLSLREAKFGVAYFSNTEKRAAELRAVLTEYVTGAASLPKGAELAKLLGRLQFASGQLFGRRARHALGALTEEPRTSPEQMRQSMQVLLSLFEHGRPRRVAATWSSVVHVYVDASFDYDGYSGIGGMAYDSSGNILGWFGSEVPKHVLDAICTYGGTAHETVIFELEAIAVLLALRSFASFLKGANIVVFTDNEGVHGAFVRCKSASVYGHQVITCACDVEESLDCLVWYERVPSSSNPSDCLSRGEELKCTSSRVQVSIEDVHKEVCAACL
ncbi:car, partial [Symbiodinium sp. CCMP2456]